MAQWAWYPKQAEAMLGSERIGLTEAGTKTGKTTAALFWLLQQALECAPGQVVWWVAPVYAQSRMAFRRMRGMVRGWRGIKINESALTITIAGRLVEFKSAQKADNLYGESVYALVLDEASRVPAPSVAAVRSTLTATNGPMRFVGNVRGRGNRFYELCALSDQGNLPGSIHRKLTTYDAAEFACECDRHSDPTKYSSSRICSVCGKLVGLPTFANIEAAKLELPPHVFRELYLAEATGSDVNPFGLDHIEAAIAPCACDPEDCDCLRDIDSVACWGVDLGRSIDYTVIVGLDIDGRVVYFDRFQKDWNTTVERIAAVLVTEADCYLDASGLGSPVVDMLQKVGVWVKPYVFTQKSKQHLMEVLALGLSKRGLTVPPKIAEELYLIEYRHTLHGVSYTAPAGYHDDCVMALGLACYGLNQAQVWSWE